MSEERRRPMRGHGPMGRGMMPGEKAKDFKGSVGKLLNYMGSYKIALVFVFIFAICSTAFNIVGPKILRRLQKFSMALCQNFPAATGLILEKSEEFFLY